MDCCNREENFAPTEHTWLCSAHFILGQESNDPLSLDYVPSVIAHTKSPVKRKPVADMHRFERVSEAMWRRAKNSEQMAAAESLIGLVACGNGTNYCEPYSEKRENDRYFNDGLPCDGDWTTEPGRAEQTVTSAMCKAQRGEFTAHWVECEELRKSLSSRRSNSSYLGEKSF